MRKNIILQIIVLVIAGIALAASFFRAPKLPLFHADAAWIAILLCGLPILKDAAEGLFTRFDIRADVLVTLALIASIIIGEDFAAGEVAFIMRVGSLLEDLTAARAREGIERLVRLTPRTARLLADGAERIIPADEARSGDLLRVLPGETVPADGKIVSGAAAVDEAVMTGEPLPVDKGPGDAVLSGTTVAEGFFDMRAENAGQDSAVWRLARLARSADAGKAKIVRLADRWATWIVVIALTAAALAWTLTGDVIRAVTILVVFCPCALVLATPAAVTAAIGNASRHHFLVREGDALERLAQTRRVVFDKTGTLTFGRPEVTAVESLVLPEAELYALAASVEARSEHPLARAVVRGFTQTGHAPAPEAEDFAMRPGRGVRARVGGREVLAGSLAFLAEMSVVPPEESAGSESSVQGASRIHLAVDGAYAGHISLADALRPDVGAVITGIRALGVKPTLLSGDREEAVRAAADRAGIAEALSRQLPEDKLAFIDALNKKGEYSCMIGDGINDAPALKAAHVGIAMGGVGSDIACDAADLVLVRDDLAELPHLLSLSRRMMRVIRANLCFSMSLNFAAIGLAAAGLLGPVSGALVHNAGSVFVIVNAAFLLTWKPQETETSPAAHESASAVS